MRNSRKMAALTREILTAVQLESKQKQKTKINVRIHSNLITGFKDDTDPPIKRLGRHSKPQPKCLTVYSKNT